MVAKEHCNSKLSMVYVNKTIGMCIIILITTITWDLILLTNANSTPATNTTIVGYVTFVFEPTKLLQLGQPQHKWLGVILILGNSWILA